MDTPVTESSALDTVQAASLLAGILEPQPVTEDPKTKEPNATETPPPEAQGDKTAEATAEQDEATAQPEKVTIEVDGKTVELTKAELAEAYKGNLRQADYTKKTMEVAEQRKAAESEASKAREERQKYADGLMQAQHLLQAQLQEQSQTIDWQKLLDSDPVEYLRQQHLANARQGRLQQIAQEQQQLHAKTQEEQAAQMRAFLQSQQEDLLAKLPEWKDEAKAKEGQAQLVEWLKSNGYPKELLSIVDRSSHLVVTARKAMLYDQMMAKAKETAKKVENLPGKVERPGGGERNALDGRTAAMKQLSRTGRVEDAARVLSNFL